MSSPQDLWSNEETWLVQLWLMDNPGANEIAKKAAREAWESAKDDSGAGVPARHSASTSAPLSRIDNATIALAHWLKDSIESNNPLKGRERDMYSELMTHTLDQVNWREIARHWIDELAK
ncbi:MAG TPA: hypothetical protein VJZ71_20630 [Phycisphaerae bacterium]|nr:hypothetical protein [Phycisphaerae bacterium]